MVKIMGKRYFLMDDLGGNTPLFFGLTPIKLEMFHFSNGQEVNHNDSKHFSIDCGGKRSFIRNKKIEVCFKGWIFFFFRIATVPISMV